MADLPTPRVDIEQRELFVLFDTADGREHYVSADFARQLERELSQANAECAVRNDEVSGLQGMLKEAEQRAKAAEVTIDEIAYAVAVLAVKGRKDA